MYTFTQLCNHEAIKIHKKKPIFLYRTILKMVNVHHTNKSLSYLNVDLKIQEEARTPLNVKDVWIVTNLFNRLTISMFAYVYDAFTGNADIDVNLIGERQCISFFYFVFVFCCCCFCIKWWLRKKIIFVLNLLIVSNVITFAIDLWIKYSRNYNQHKLSFGFFLFIKEERKKNC